MFSTLAFSSLAMDVRVEAVAARLSVRDVAFDATRITRNTGKFCAFPGRFGRHLCQEVGSFAVSPQTFGYLSQD
jgi:hypothetical protein